MLLFEKGLTLAVTLSVTVVVARHLMPESFGRLSFLLALMTIAAPLMALGLNSLISRELLQRSVDTDVIIGSAMVLRFAAGLLIAALFSGVALFFLSVSDAKHLALLLFCSISNCTLIIDFWLQAHVANFYASRLRFGTTVVYSVLRLSAVTLDADLEVFVYLLASEFVVTGLGYIALYQYLSGRLFFLQSSLNECSVLLKDSRWLFFSGIAAVLYLKIDQVMLGVLVDDRAVGMYALAAKFSEVWYFVPAALVTSYFPRLIRKHANSDLDYACDIQKLNDFLFAAAVMIALVVTITGKWLVPFLLGEAYAEVLPILLVHVWAAVLVFMRALLSKWLIVENLLRLSLLSQVAGALANIALNAYLIPLYGPLGAAYATVFSYFIAGYGILFFNRKLWPMAFVITRSLLLPLRFIRWGFQLYETESNGQN